jgi:membrane-associated phospholipid phosphatase
MALLVLTWYLAFHVSRFERVDRSLLGQFIDFSHRPHVGGLANRIAHLCNPNPYVYLAAVPVVVALARRRGWLAIAICATLLGANVTTQLLKPLLAHGRLPASGLQYISAASWPSGHATAAMSLTLCAILAAPARLRPLVAAAGALFTVAVCYSFLSLGWHFPSDVFGGFLVAATWTLLAIAAIYILGGRGAARATESPGLSLAQALAPPALALATALLLAVIVVLVRPQQVVAYARLHHTFVIGAGAIGLAALALATGLTVALRR